jgi:hypothetical protein
MEAPEIFRKWAGIGILASVLERKVWNRTNKGVLYPNLYVVLVGPPGTGKSLLVSFSEKMLRALNDIHVAPSSVTSASLIDTLQMSIRKILHPTYFQYNSLQVIVSEFQNFLVSYESQFMGILTKLYDCELYEERRRTGKVQHIRIDNTQLGILAGTTPSFLSQLLPEGAWDQGFTSRTIFIFADTPTEIGEIFGEEDDFEYNQQALEDHIADLKGVLHLVGQIRWTDVAKVAAQKWADNGCLPVPEHGRLTHYNTRRLTQVLKLSLIASVARNNDMLVEPQDFDTGLAWLLEAESHMPDIFRHMTTTPESRSMEDARFYMKQMMEKVHGPVPEHFLLAFLKDRIPSQHLTKVIEVMVKSRMLKSLYKDGVTYYTVN